MKARLFWLLVLTVALVALPAAALGSTARTTVNSQSFPDSTGEDANAPDITSTTVSNDDAGQITFKINISNRPAMTSDMVIVVFLNTDQNTATGDPDVLGTDYLIELDPGVVGLFKWDGTTYSPADSQTSLTFGYDATGATLHVSAADLGQTKGFSFAVVAVSGITTDANGDPDFTNAHRDLSPDAGHGFFSYSVLAQLVLKQTAFTTAPKPAKAGARFTATLAATENDTNGPVTGATVACAAKIGTKGVPATHSFANGVASCSWKLPKTAKGKTLRGTVMITTRGATLKKSFAVKVS